MSSMINRALMVMRSLSLKTHTFTLCVVAGTLLLCFGLFKEPNIDTSHTTTSVEMEMETASASDLTIEIQVDSLTMNSEDIGTVIEVAELSLDEEEDSLSAPSGITLDEYIELSKLVEAEAKSEDLKGKTLVANVVMNRIASEIFPTSITEVIYDPGQFDPVDNGYIKYANPTHDSKQAVIDALSGVDYSSGALYFQKSAATTWGDKQYLFRHGSHSFYK